MRDQAAELRERMRKAKAKLADSPQRNVSLFDDKSDKKRALIAAVTSGKGGVGKTTFVINLGIALSSLGEKVIIIDADMGMANVNVALGISPKYTLFDVIKGHKTITDILVEGPGDILIAPGGSGIKELADLSEEQRNIFIKEFLYLEKLADIILLDTGAGISTSVLKFNLAADEIFVITMPEPPAIQDAYGMIKTIHNHNCLAKINLVINRAQDAKEYNSAKTLIQKTIKDFLGILLDDAGYIKDDVAVSESIKQQEPFILKYPYSRASDCIRQIAKRFLKERGLIKRTGLSAYITKILSYFEG